ncbi:hypothetical protein CHS0354_020874 [Potamilus streckersoni]|uniref:Beta-1,4-galactosyltransferase n=1 Tax=Potamilus streckersoni TaxID=2493646 RepID=A0AAE0SFS9_9BIVA|nr:hypothetical protein CHS0354_020874 [Potamilus streckersoni]
MSLILLNSPDSHKMMQKTESSRTCIQNYKNMLLVLTLIVVVIIAVQMYLQGCQCMMQMYKSCDNTNGFSNKSKEIPHNVPGISSKLCADTSKNVEHLIAHTSSRQNRSALPLCPEQPPHLVGKMNIKPTITLQEVTNEESLRNLSYGGRYAPPYCQAREKTAIIIPYRDRKEHIDILVRHLHTVLQRQQLEYGIYVVEMALPTQFNRGLLANAGVRTARGISSYTCYIIHDVDSLMTDDRNLYRCGSQPIHFMTGSTKYKYNGIPYPGFHGGIVGFTPEQYKTVNGFSNLYFGWGSEDDDLGIRVQKSGMIFVRPKEEIGMYVALPHVRDVSNQENPNSYGLVRNVSARQMQDGVETIRFKRFALEYQQLYTWLLIGVKEDVIVKKFQKYLEFPTRG